MPLLGSLQHRDLLAAQLTRTGRLVAILRARGVAQDAELAIDYAFTAPSITAAERLIVALSARTPDELGLAVTRTGHRNRATLRVEGRVARAAASGAHLKAWTEEMVELGCAQGGCAFSGWRAATPRR